MSELPRDPQDTGVELIELLAEEVADVAESKPQPT